MVETKSHKGDIYAEPRAKEWVQVIGGKRETMYNPLFQNKTHVDALRYQLQKNKIYKIPVDSIVVFSGANKKNLYIEKGHPVVDIRYLKQFLNRSNFLMRDAGVDTEQLVSFLKSIQITDAKTLKKHDQDVRKHSR